jgi:hypothetical protein
VKFVYNGEMMVPFADAIADHIKGEIVGFGVAVLDILKESSYSIALVGGGVCLLVYLLTGVRRAGKAFGVLMLAHGIIRFLLGG